MWRLHCAFDLPAERFSFIALTDEKGGERLDRIPFAKGDIVIADRGFMHPDPLAHVLEQGADVIVRTPWKGALSRDNLDENSGNQGENGGSPSVSMIAAGAMTRKRHFAFRLTRSVTPTLF